MSTSKTPTNFAKDDLEGTISVTEGQVELRDQLRDYQFQGKQLATLNLFDFMVNTYGLVTGEEKVLHWQR